MDRASQRFSFSTVTLLGIFGLSLLSACKAVEKQVAGDKDVAINLTTSVEPTHGWTDPDGNPFKIELVESVGATSPISVITYDCRTGPIGSVDGLAFTPCDGGSGTGSLYAPTKDSTHPSGMYRTDIKAKLNGELKSQRSLKYYMHESLDGAQPCPNEITAEAYIAKARDFLDTSTQFGSQTSIVHPIVKIQFDSETIEYRTLRKQFVKSSDSRLVAVVRKFGSRSRNGSCVAFSIRKHVCEDDTGLPGLYCDGTGARVKLSCDAIVMAASGKAVCLANNAGTPAFVWNFNALAHRYKQRQDIYDNDECSEASYGFSRKTTNGSCTVADDAWDYEVINLPE